MNKSKVFILLNIILCLFLLIIPEAKSQNYHITTGGGQQIDECIDMVTDASGNVYITGYFSQVMQLGGINMNSNGYLDIFVAKIDPVGSILWLKKAGGQGADKGLSIALDPAGNCFVTGFYSTFASFDGFTLSAINATQDIFLAKYDGITGDVLWVKSAGGAMTGDMGYKVCSDPLGNVYITGQFRGQVNFGSISVNSMIDPIDGLPSYDVFIAKYDGSGNEVWVKQGNAKYTDRGMSIASDDSGNIYVTGQFSDTIQFTNTYNNNMMNAIFLMKIDPEGNELWFRRIGGGQMNIAYGLLVKGKDLYITGDNKGNQLIFFQPGQNQTISNSTYYNKIFVAKYDTSGTFIKATTEASASDISSRTVAVTLSGDVYIGGHFKCVFSNLANYYGQGTFNSVGYWDIYAIKFNNNLERTWAQQAGSVNNDHCWTNAINTSNQLLIGGSYWNNLNIPRTNAVYNVTGNLTKNNTANSPNALCADPFYNFYLSINSRGNGDLIAGQVFDESRAPYDYYYREGSTCNRPYLGVCAAENCADTIALCGPNFISSNTQTTTNIHLIDINSIAPAFHYNWSNGDTTFNSFINTSGNYSLQLSSYDGCFVSSDTIYVQVNPVPLIPPISDSKGVNTFKINTNPVFLCFPDSVLLTGHPSSNIQTRYWINTNIGTVNSDSVWAKNSGWYTFNVIDSNNCVNTNKIYVKVDVLPLYDLRMRFPLDTFYTDTIRTCPNKYIRVFIYDTITNPAAITTLPYCIDVTQTLWQNYPVPNFSNSTCPNQAAISFLPVQTGWYYFNATVIRNNTCGTDTTLVSDSIYIIVYPAPEISPFQIFGNEILCPGDTIPLWTTLQGNYIYDWSNIDGSGISGPNDTDSINIYNSGNYKLEITVLDSNGCQKKEAQYKNVIFKPQPNITAQPSHGVICPGDSVLLTVNIAGKYLWHGPSGWMNYDTLQSVYVNIAGFYYCLVTDNDSCQRVSNTFEVRNYTTPFLEITPHGILCPGDSIQLEVFSSTFGIYQWSAPLFGSDSIQWIYQPGTYTCVVTSCNIPTSVSANIIISPVEALITASQTGTLCAGDSVTLYANSGMTTYEWQPGGQATQIIVVNNPGAYNVVVTDFYGCKDTSAFVSVNFHPEVNAPTASDTTICHGNSVTLNASSSNPIQWLDAPGGNLLAMSNAFTTNPLYSDTSYFVTSTDFSCSSIPLQVNVFMSIASLAPQLSFNNPVCVGGTLELTTPGIINGIYQWIGPDNFSSALQNPTITNVNSTNQGTYSLIIGDGVCQSPMSTLYIEFDAMPVLNLNNSGVVCQGDSLFLYADTLNGSYSWTGPGNFSSTFISPSLIASIQSSGFYYLEVSFPGCPPVKDSIEVTVLAQPPAPALSYNSPLCEYDTLFLNATFLFNAQYNWNGVQSFTSNLQNPFIYPALAGNYTATVTLDGCQSQEAYLMVNVQPTPLITNISVNTPICQGSSIILTGQASLPSVFIWYDPFGISYQGNPFTILNSDTTYNGTYELIVVANGCFSQVSSIEIDVVPLPLLDTIIIVASCDGSPLIIITDSLTGAIYHWSGPMTITSNQNPLIIPNANSSYAGTYSVYASVNGCIGNSVNATLTVFPLPEAPNAQSNSPVCMNDTLVLSATGPANSQLIWNGLNLVDTGQTVYFTSQTSGWFTYYVTAQVNGCASVPDTLLVEIMPGPENPYPFSNDPVCTNDTLYLYSSHYNGQNYQWTGPLGFQSTNSSDLIGLPSTFNSGYYILNTNVGNCSITDSILVQVYIAPIVSLGNDTIICNGETLLLEPANNFAQYFWQDYSSSNSFNVGSSGVYFVWVSDSAGCAAMDSIEISYIPCNATFPNVFTPNGDKKNDFFTFDSKGYSEFDLKIFNRWGTLIAELNLQANSWDGTLFNGNQAPEGVYFIEFSGVTFEGQIDSSNAFFHLLR
ncbi:MAG: gliding motility-associated C-terminal domain-containing protein [Bacteroidetes bacterium]|nr:gliding motility-associated C-terminal domain-containing protein [Bacteroidota bacterium]HET6245867.1 gliding motility-associated C-terminal domain-containing protein [Bacteroidia bacterium]